MAAAVSRPSEFLDYARLRRLGNDAWLKALLDSIDGKGPSGLPGFPPPDLQAGFVGSSNEAAIREAFNFYTLMADRRRQYGRRLTPFSHVLDFGCGWGRYARMFMRDVPASHIWCADSWDLAINICRDTGVRGRLVQLDQMPPSTLPTAQFDTAFAYSVFSHLSPKAHAAWRKEFGRVMKPGGLVFITTQARWFVDKCERLRTHPEEVTGYWQELLAASFVDHAASLAAYDRGEMLYAPNGGGPSLSPEFYGDAVVPREHFEKEWASHFEVLEFVSDRENFEQAIVIMRRRR